MITVLFTRYCQEMTLLHKFQIGWGALIWMLYKLENILLLAGTIFLRIKVQNMTPIPLLLPLKSLALVQGLQKFAGFFSRFLNS